MPHLMVKFIRKCYLLNMPDIGEGVESAVKLIHESAL